MTKALSHPDYPAFLAALKERNGADKTDFYRHDQNWSEFDRMIESALVEKA